MPDVTGPDGVRVTLRVEPAGDRLRRWRFMFFTPRVLTDPLARQIHEGIQNEGVAFLKTFAR